MCADLRTRRGVPQAAQDRAAHGLCDVGGMEEYLTPKPTPPAYVLGNLGQHPLPLVNQCHEAAQRHAPGSAYQPNRPRNPNPKLLERRGTRRAGATEAVVATGEVEASLGSALGWQRLLSLV